MYLHAERLLAKAGRQGARGGESPILGAEAKLERKGRSAAEVCTSEARKTAGNPLRRVRAGPSVGTEDMVYTKDRRDGLQIRRFEGS
ncbi:MAG TPA: hypothetical protein VK638_06700 [Edaphobacter sp.]|nr:hypothetical protein [Edaphobacter sp.]